jgi:hypothetical protein
MREFSWEPLDFLDTLSAEAEKVLNVEFPPDLRSFFLEAGGLVADYGCEVI